MKMTQAGEFWGMCVSAATRPSSHFLHAESEKRGNSQQLSLKYMFQKYFCQTDRLINGLIGQRVAACP